MPFANFNNGLDWAILTAKNPVYQYEGGKRVSDTPIAQRVNVLLPGNCFSAITVKISTGIDLLPEITEEMIADACASMKPIFEDSRIVSFLCMQWMD
jgi:hypothetical protein